MNKRLVTSIFAVLLVASMLLTACAPAAPATTEAPAAPAATEVPAAPAATEAPAAPAATEAPAPAPTEAPAAEGPKTGGRITVMDTSGFYTLDPFETPWFTLTQGAIYDTLVTIDLELKEYVPLLAKSWEVAADNLSLTIQLRDDVTFQDGTQMDAAAVKWNFDKYLRGEAKINGVWKDYISEFVVDDDYTLTIKFIKPYAPIFSDLNLSYIVSPTQYEKLGVEGFGREPIGTGPWIAKEIVENDHVLYVRNPDYKWAPSFADNQGAVYPDELYLRFLSDNAVAYAALETGEASIIGLPAQFLADAQGNSDIVLNKGIDWSTWYMGMNNQNAPFTDLDFRKALAYGVNRDEVLLAAFEGEAFPLYSSLAPSTWGYQESQNEAGMAADSYDPEKAKELLAGLGYADGNGDGILEKDGKDLTLKLNFPPADDTQRAATTIQSQLLEIGVNVELGPMEPAAISAMLQKCEQDLFLRPFGLSDASILSAVFHSSRMGTSNRNCWTDEKTDELIDAADTTMDPDARMDAVNNLVLYLVEQRPHIPLWAPYNYVASRVELKGLQYYKNGAYYLGSAWVE